MTMYLLSRLLSIHLDLEAHEHDPSLCQHQSPSLFPHIPSRPYQTHDLTFEVIYIWPWEITYFQCHLQYTRTAGMADGDGVGKAFVESAKSLRE